MKSKLFTWCAIALSCMKLNAQDPQFSQFYANPIYLNPAFAGTNVCGRLNLNFRDQWPAIEGTYVTYSASYDQHLNNFGGMGVLISSDNAAKGAIVTNRLGWIYAYQKPILQDLAFSAAVQLDVEQKTLNSTNLALGDRIDPRYGFSGDPNSGEILPNTSVIYPDFSAGALLYGNN